MTSVLPPNSAGLACDTLHRPQFDVLDPKHHAGASLIFPALPTLKRKRTFTDDVVPFAVTGRAPYFGDDVCPALQFRQQEIRPATEDLHRHAADLQQESESIAMDIEPTVATVPDRSTVPSSKCLKQTISSQISLEILLKHKELRLIDQELAKCQVALEQLRRCHEIPFPGMHSLSPDVSQGHGLPSRQSNQRHPAVSPAPWGVTDGPYTRHYAQWLLPDRLFDGGEPERFPHAACGTPTPLSGRSTRGYHVDVSAASKSRSGRNNPLQSLPAGYVQPREKATGPMILKRKSDGKSVKLVCPDCGRHDFGSAQGFINHCRIGHQRSFASHDAAAEACGEPVELDEHGSIKGSESVTTSTATTVHPLVRSAKVASNVIANTSFLADRFSKATAQDASHASDAWVSITPSAAYSKSEHTPHLSALVARSNLALDLEELVAEAKLKTEQESDDDEDDRHVECLSGLSTGRHPQVAGSKQPAKSARGVMQSSVLPSTMRVPVPSGNGASPQTDINAEPGSSAHHSMHAMLPSPTNESTQAPSLVDDDEEFDPQSPASMDDSDLAEPDVEFEVHDEEHGERLGRMKNGDLEPVSGASCASPAPHVADSNVGRRALVPQHESLRDVFASPSPAPEASSNKRRKLGPPSNSKVN